MMIYIEDRLVDEGESETCKLNRRLLLLGRADSVNVRRPLIWSQNDGRKISKWHCRHWVPDSHSIDSFLFSLAFENGGRLGLARQQMDRPNFGSV